MLGLRLKKAVKIVAAIILSIIAAITVFNACFYIFKQYFS